MGFDMTISAWPRGAVRTMKTHFEILAMAEMEEALKYTKRDTQLIGADQWLEIYREKRHRSEPLVSGITSDTDSCQEDDTTSVDQSREMWLDIYREKRRLASDVSKGVSRKNSIKKAKASKKELEQRIMSLMARCYTLEDLLELSMAEEKSGNDTCAVWFPAEKSQKSERKQKVRFAYSTRCLT